MGKYNTKNNLPKTSIIIVNYLKDIGIDSLERANNDNTNNIVEYLWEMGRIAVRNELNIIALRKLLKILKIPLKN